MLNFKSKALGDIQNNHRAGRILRTGALDNLHLHAYSDNAKQLYKENVVIFVPIAKFEFNENEIKKQK